MLKIIANQIINEQRYDIPKILPNNLELIKLNYGISNSDISNALSINKRFIDTVVKEQANFSGLSVIKFIKYYDLPFNLIYNVNKEVTFSENTYKRHIAIFETTKDNLYDTEEQQESLNGYILAETISKKLIKDNDNAMIKFILPIKDKLLNYSKEIKSDNYNSDLIKYQDFVSKMTYDFESYNYYALVYEIIEDIEVTKMIDLNKNFDMDLINYLEKKSFIRYKYKTIKVPKESVKLEGDIYILPEEYSFINNDQIEVTNKIHYDLCKVKRKTIEFDVVYKVINDLTKFKYLREYKNYSEKEMADKLCVSEDTYKAIEKGNIQMSALIMWKLELEFGVLLQYIINIDEYYNKYCK